MMVDVEAGAGASFLLGLFGSSALASHNNDALRDGFGSSAGARGGGASATASA
jgi:hypothetical protein